LRYAKIAATMGRDEDGRQGFMASITLKYSSSLFKVTLQLSMGGREPAALNVITCN
jgi:hypothetical protein